MDIIKSRRKAAAEKIREIRAELDSFKGTDREREKINHRYYEAAALYQELTKEYYKDSITPPLF